MLYANKAANFCELLVMMGRCRVELNKKIIEIKIWDFVKNLKA